MEAGTTPQAPPNGGTPDDAAAGAAPPPAPPAPPEDPPAAAGASARAQAEDRQYAVFTELALDLSSAASKKEAIQQLEALVAEGAEGKLTVLARIGNVVAPDPRKAVKNLGQVRELDGDYEVIAHSARNRYQNVKTSREVSVSIG